MQRQEITEIKISRSCLQNPHNESPLQLLLESDKHLACIDEIISTITNAKLTSYIVIVDDNKPLDPQETIMLQAAQHYIAEHFKNLVPSENSTQVANNSSAAAAAAAVATVTAAASAATAALSEAAATETATVVAAAATATVAATAAINTTTTTATDTAAATDTADVIDVNTGTTVTDTLASDTTSVPENNSNTDSKPTDEFILDKVLKIINLEIWARKGRGMFGYSDPDGIVEMKKIENPSLDEIFKIALEKHCQSGLSTSTRANMTGRFYEMLFSLKQSTDLSTCENLLMEFAKKELIRNYNSSKNRSIWSFGKVVLSDADINTLCVIANIEPKDIETLANSTTAVAAAAAATAAVSASSDASASASAVTDPDADEAPQTGLRP